MNPVVILGKRSVVSQAIQRYLAPESYKVFQSHEIQQFAQHIQSPLTPPSTVINCVGFTDVEGANEDPAECFRWNVTFARAAISALKGTTNHRFVHISSDYALADFRKYAPDAIRAVYAFSKLEGERAVRSIAARHDIRNHTVYLSTVLSIEKYSMVRAALEATESLEIDLPDTRLLRPTFVDRIPKRLFSQLAQPECPEEFTIGPLEAVTPRMIVNYTRAFASLPPIRVIARDQRGRAYRPEWTMAPMPFINSAGHWTDHISEYVDNLFLRRKNNAEH